MPEPIPIKTERKKIHGQDVEVKIFDPKTWGVGPLSAEEWYWTRVRLQWLAAKRLGMVFSRRRTGPDAAKRLPETPEVTR